MIWIDKFFINLCILVTCLFFLHQVFKERKVHPSDNLYKRINFGLVQGVLGWLLMHYSLSLGWGVVFDLRMIPVFLAAATGGWAAALTTALVISLGRIVLFSWTPATMVATVALIVTAIMSGLIVRFVANEARRWMYMVFANVILVAVGTMFAIPDPHLRWLVLLQYALVLAIASLFTYLLVHHLTRSYELFLKIRDSARVDFLTELNNVRSFDEAINSLLQKNLDYGENLSFLMIDIDHFKKVNDTYGHPAGDEVLKQLGDLLSTTSRGRDIVSRNGGEEFSVILPGCARENALHVAERLRAAIEHHAFRLPDGQVISVTASFGLSVSTPDLPLTAEELVHLADEGLYRAKRSGRNQVCEFQPVST